LSNIMKKKLNLVFGVDVLFLTRRVLLRCS
jgi:hypothetical protein